MSLTTHSGERPPLWNKSMARYLGGAAPLPDGDGRTVPAQPVRPAIRFDEKTLARLGLKPPPSDPKLLGEFLVEDDATDAELATDEFARGIRRAVRLTMALSAGLHRQAGQPWKEWVEARFKVGYPCFHRYHVAADLQIGLIARGLPLLVNENQSRSIAPFRKHEKFWEALASDAFKTGFPNGQKLKSQLCRALGLEGPPAATTVRIKLHRILQRIVVATPAADDDPVVGEAVTLIRRAILVLEKGRTST